MRFCATLPGMNGISPRPHERFQPGWWGGADVCVALVEKGRYVDWAPGSYVPDVQIWVPETSFSLIADAASHAGVPLGDIAAVMSGEQVRLCFEGCASILRGWSAVEDAVECTPADGWAVAMRLVFQRCGDGCELLLEGP